MASVDMDGSSSGEDAATRRGRAAAASVKKNALRQDVACGGELCGLCDTGGFLPKRWRGLFLHPECWNGIRCHLRLLTKPAAKEADKKFMAKDMEKRKKMVLRLVVTDHTVRDHSLVKNHRENIKQATFTKEAEVSDMLYLSKRRFAAYMKFWEGYGSDSASESWDRRHAETDSNHSDSDGNKRVRVKDNTKVRTEVGRRESKTQGDVSGRAHRHREQRRQPADEQGDIESHGTPANETKKRTRSRGFAIIICCDSSHLGQPYCPAVNGCLR